MQEGKTTPTMELQEETKMAGIGTVKWEDEDTGFDVGTETSNDFELLIQGVGPGTIQSSDGPKQGSTVAQILLPFSVLGPPQLMKSCSTTKPH